MFNGSSNVPAAGAVWPDQSTAYAAGSEREEWQSWWDPNAGGSFESWQAEADWYKWSHMPQNPAEQFADACLRFFTTEADVVALSLLKQLQQDEEGHVQAKAQASEDQVLAGQMESAVAAFLAGEGFEDESEDEQQEAERTSCTREGARQGQVFCSGRIEREALDLVAGIDGQLSAEAIPFVPIGGFDAFSPLENIAEEEETKIP
eukprot:s4060_g13.t1